MSFFKSEKRYLKRSGLSDRFLRIQGLKVLKLLMVIMMSMTLMGCSSDQQTIPESRPSSGSEATSEPESTERYEVPEFADSVFDKDAARSKNGAYIDLSNVSKGYVAVSAVSDARLKFQVITDVTYNYDLSNDGEVSIFPLQSGNGEYQFRVMENVTENRYAIMFDVSQKVTLEDEFQPFIRPSDYVSYTRDSECVKLASSFAQESTDVFDLIHKVYDYVCANVKYDKKKAETVQSGYLPDPDETLSTGKGICFDYASLTAAMLRSQGIPVKVIFGHVSPNNLYHAWNMFYTEEAGWVTVEFKVDQQTWTRMDLTFMANGSNLKFIGDGSNYADVYEY